MGALTEDPVLATAVLAKPAVGLPGITPEGLARIVGDSAADIVPDSVRWMPDTEPPELRLHPDRLDKPSLR